MHRLLTAVTSVAVSTLLLSGTALAKGAESATIEGGSLSSPIRISVPDGRGDPGAGPPLWKIAEQSGFWPGSFGQVPDPMLDHRPVGDLGIFYTITWIVPSPEGGNDLITQRVYPYASGGPVTYMAPGQSFFGTEKTRGGWYEASPKLNRTLVRAGIPAEAPAATSGSATETAASSASSINWSWFLVIITALVLGVAAILMLRRKPSVV